jgi:hypothetical protein
VRRLLLAVRHGSILSWKSKRRSLQESQADSRWTTRREFVDLIISALALRRGAAAVPLVTVLRRRGGDSEEAPFVVESRAPLYRRNLLGGVISGEDPAALGRLVAAGLDSLVRLWLGARRDIASERDNQFAVHRWWNLI